METAAITETRSTQPAEAPTSTERGSEHLGDKD